MITTTYTCDRCKKTVDKASRESLWNVEVHVDTRNAWERGSSISYPQARSEWCRSCCEELAILPRPTSKPKSEPVPEVTLEQKLLAIVATMVDEALDARKERGS